MSSLQLTDFSDRFPPMLVKELRQGLRAKTFIGVFLALQIFLAVMLFSASAASNSDQVGGIVSGVLFSFFAIAVIVVQPLRGTNALAAEIKGQTIDMMVLTRLSAWRIVFGKWFAIVSQSALLLSAIIPYLILRYFLGGMNLVGEIVFLFLLFLTSMGITAVTVGLSGCTSVIVRSLLPVIGLPFLAYLLLMLSFSGAMGGGNSLIEICALDSTESRIGVLCYILAIIYLSYSLLSMGASLIAPAAENHSAVRRLLALALLAATAFSGFFELLDEAPTIILICLIAIPAVIIALVESGPLVQTVRRPFEKFGPPGKLLGHFLYPTWSSGVFFAVILTILAIISIFGHGLLIPGSTTMLRDFFSSSDADDKVIVFAIAGGFFFPALWQMIFFRGEGQRVANYLLILTGSYVLLGVLSALTNAMESSIFLLFFAWNPLVFLPIMDEGSFRDSTLLVAILFIVSLTFLALLLGAVRHAGSQHIGIDESEPTPPQAD